MTARRNFLFCRRLNSSNIMSSSMLFIYMSTKQKHTFHRKSPHSSYIVLLYNSYSEPRCSISCSTCEIKGCHITSNFLIDPFTVSLIFSILRKNMTSQIPLPKVGGLSFFQLKRMSPKGFFFYKETEQDTSP